MRQTCIFLILCIYDFFVIHAYSNKQSYMCADFGPERPTGMSPIARRAPLAHDPQAEGGKGSELVQNLECIAQGILDYAHLEDVPMAYQRHTVGVPSRLH